MLYGLNVFPLFLNIYFPMDNKKNNPALKSFDDFKSEISIMELALANGYEKHKEKTSARYPVLKHAFTDDVIVIGNAKSNLSNYYFSGGLGNDHDKGSLINFVKYRLGTVFPNDASKNVQSNINNVLYKHLNIDPTMRSNLKHKMDQIPTVGAAPRQSDVVASLASVTPLKDYSFLLSRGFSKDAIFSEPFNGSIFNSTSKFGHQNIAFPLYSNGIESVTGFEIRNKQFKGALEHSDRLNAIGLSNKPIMTSTLHLTESGIDALAKYQLSPSHNTRYVYFVGGLSDNQLFSLDKEITKAGRPALQLGFDNDLQGAAYSQKVLRHLIPYQSFTEAAPAGFVRIGFSSPGNEKSLVDFGEKLFSSLKKNSMLENAKSISVADKMDSYERSVSVTLEAKQDRLVFQLPKDLSTMQGLNKSLIDTGYSLNLFKVEINLDTPLSKDFNDDLKMLNRVSVLDKSIKTYDDLKLSFRSGKDFSSFFLQAKHDEQPKQATLQTKII